jgi:hypothetical protein
VKSIVIPVLPQRDSTKIDMILGKRRPALNSEREMDWSECPLAMAYPNWDLFLYELHNERETAAKEDRPAHPRAAAPAIAPSYAPPLESRAKGMTVEQAKRRYGSKD